MSWKFWKRKEPEMPVEKASDVFTTWAGADLLGIAPSTLLHQARRGRVPGAHKMGSTWLFTRRGLEYYKTNSLGRFGLASGQKINRGG